jgi:hypothetical protein
MAQPEPAAALIRFSVYSVETIMSQNVEITTPLHFIVGGRKYSLITLQDLYDRCRENPKLFSELIKQPDETASILARLALVLPEECLRQLINLLNDPRLVALAQEYLKDETPWPTTKVLYWGETKDLRMKVPCTWPNCPSD